MYRLYAAISIIIGMYLDSVLFAKVNIAGVVPDCVLVVMVGVCAFLKENLMAILTRMVGGRFSYFGMLITYMVPSALMSAALCIPAHALLKPRLMLSAKKRYDRSAGGIK